MNLYMRKKAERNWLIGFRGFSRICSRVPMELSPFSPLVKRTAAANEPIKYQHRAKVLRYAYTLYGRR